VLNGVPEEVPAAALPNCKSNNAKKREDDDVIGNTKSTYGHTYTHTHVYMSLAIVCIRLSFVRLPLAQRITMNQ
jgi:hypothetical protein